MKKKILLYSFLLTVFYGCNSEVKELTFSTPMFKDTIYPDIKILNDTFMMSYAFDLDYYKDYLVLTSHRNEKFVHLFNKNTGEYVKSVLGRGRGQGETLNTLGININQQTGEALCYDMMERKINYFNIDTVAVHAHTSNYIWGENLSFYAHKLFSGKYGYIAIGGGSRDTDGRMPRFSILQSDSVVNQYYLYPSVKISGIDKPLELKMEKAYTFTNSSTCLSPNGDKMVCVSSYGAILEIFELSSDSIHLNTVKGFYRPEFDLGKNGAPIPIEGETIWGFRDVYATSNYIYTIFLGDTRMIQTENNKIAVFDWEGNCERLYQVVGYKLEKICVDPSQNRLYAIALNADHEYSLLCIDL